MRIYTETIFLFMKLFFNKFMRTYLFVPVNSMLFINYARKRKANKNYTQRVVYY